MKGMILLLFFVCYAILSLQANPLELTANEILANQPEKGIIEAEAYEEFEVQPDPQRVINIWDGSAGTNWNNYLNWSQNHVPTATEAVEIPSGLSNYPIIAAGGSFSCGSVSMATGTSLTINGILTLVYSATVPTTGTLTCAGALSMPNELAKLYIGNDAIFNNGSTLSILYNGAEIFITDDAQFNYGSFIDPAYGTITFTGDGPSITTNASVSLYNLKSNSTNLRHQVGEFPLTITNSLVVQANKTYICNTEAITVLKKGISLDTGAVLQFNAGTVNLQGNVSPTINIGAATNYFNNLTITKYGGAYVTLSNHIHVKGDLQIDSGQLRANTYSIYLSGNWTNNVGAGGFNPSVTSTAGVYFESAENQYITTNENFNRIYRSGGGALFISTGVEVYCQRYYSQEASSILGVHGNFNVNNATNNSFNQGYFFIWGNMTYYNDYSTAPYLGANIRIYGGSLNIYGYVSPAILATGGSLDMTDGNFYFNDVGVTVQAGFTTDITNGHMYVDGDLITESTNFDPTGGYLHLTGDSACVLSLLAPIFSLNIAKGGGANVILQSNLNSAGGISITGGWLIASDKLVFARG